MNATHHPRLLESHVVGTRDFPLSDKTIGAAFDVTVERWGDRVALGVPQQGVRWTYKELAGRVRALAIALSGFDLRPGDRIGLWAPNRAEWLVVQHAAAKLGLILVCINPAYRASELEFALNKVGCKALVTAQRLKGSDYLAILGDIAPEIAACEPGKLRAARLPDLKILIHLGEEAVPGYFCYEDLLVSGARGDDRRLLELSAQVKCGDPVAIVFTSGTTGSPKGATFSHHQLLNNGAIDGQVMRLTERDSICLPLPLYHIFGMLTGNLIAMLFGAEIVYTGEVFEPGAALQAIEQEKCSVIYGVPTVFKMLLDHPERAKFDLSSLRTGLVAGAAVPESLCRRVIDELHVPGLLQIFGMTESSATLTIPDLDDPLERRIGTTGHIIPHIEIKLVDAEGTTVPVGASGELCFRGFTVTLGYWNDEAKTREAIDAEGWMRSGDLATMDEQGYFRIVGRLKEIIIRGGENIHPGDIEQYLSSHPKVDMACIVGVPDEKFGEELLACIRLKPGAVATAEEIRDYCRGQIAHYKIPKHIQFLESFPMTVTGKVQRHLLQREAINQMKPAI
ncbi:MAG: AMP-binding protein [Sulfuricaulis sp.]|nr:AMP-binding protein [Sulfuricaulis sp.]